MTTKKSQNIPKFFCVSCQYKTNNKKDYSKHLNTLKHNVFMKKTELQVNTTEYPKEIPKTYQCTYCDKNYKYRDGLWRHSKKCVNRITSHHDIFNNNDTKALTELVIKMFEQNQALTKQIVDQNQKLTKQIDELSKNNTININNNTNSNNKIFNLQLFLNEQCKDAMNMSDFINSLQLKPSDLENVGKLGYVEGISNIIIKQLNDTDMYKRPLHCSDVKRETLYIKEEDKWEKEGPENTKMKKVIKTVEKKNIELITEWTQEHPRYRESASHDNDAYLKLLTESMSGDEEHLHKVIKNISKEVAIEK